MTRKTRRSRRKTARPLQMLEREGKRDIVSERTEIGGGGIGQSNEDKEQLDPAVEKRITGEMSHPGSTGRMEEVEYEARGSKSSHEGPRDVLRATMHPPEATKEHLKCTMRRKRRRKGRTAGGIRPTWKIRQIERGVESGQCGWQDGGSRLQRE